MNEQMSEWLNCFHPDNSFSYNFRLVPFSDSLYTGVIYLIVSFSTLRLNLTSRVKTQNRVAEKNPPAALILLHTMVSLKEDNTQHPLELFG